MTREQLKENLNILMVARHYKHYSQDIDEIAAVMCMSPEKIKRWMDTPEWFQCCAYWGNRPRLGDFSRVARAWTELIDFDEHLYPTELPDVIFANGHVLGSEPLAESIKNNALEMRQYRPDILIAEPFCVEGLCDEQIRDRIAQEKAFGYTPMKYENQYLQGYYWWLYPNWDRGVFSKVFAKANIFGNLVCGAGEKTHLVCIESGRFTLTRQVSDDVVSVLDERLLVCL